MIKRIFGLRPKPIASAGKPVRDRKYLAYIRRFPCVGCGSTRWIEAMHTGPHGLGQKSSDMKALPACDDCHRTGNESMSKLGPVKWEEVHGKDIAALIVMFNGYWVKEIARRERAA